jgi:hypothetical protein
MRRAFGQGSRQIGAVDSKKAGDNPASMQSLWQGSVAAVGARVATAEAVGGVVIRA